MGAPFHASDEPHAKRTNGIGHRGLNWVWFKPFVSKRAMTAKLLSLRPVTWSKP